MPVNTFQVANVVLSDTFTQFANKTNELVSIVNGLPSTIAGGIDRTGGVIDGTQVGTIPVADTTGSLFIVGSSTNRGLAIGDFLSGSFPTDVGTDQIHILKTDVAASINVTSTTVAGSYANVAIRGLGSKGSAIRLLEAHDEGMVIHYIGDGTDKLNIKDLPAGGAEVDRFTLTRDGMIGIGTTSPTTDGSTGGAAGALDVRGTLYASGATVLGSTLSAIGGLSTFSSVRVTGVFQDTSGVAGSSSQVLTSTGAGTHWTTLSGAGAASGSGTIHTLAKWSATDTIAASIITESSGTIGINEASPDQMLHVSGADAQIILWESDTEFVRLGVEATEGDVVLGWHDTEDMQIGVFDAPADASVVSHMTILSGGNVGINDTSPGYKLTVGGTLGVTGLTTFNEDVAITSDKTLTVGTGLVDLGGALTVDGDTSIGYTSGTQHTTPLAVYGGADITVNPSGDSMRGRGWISLVGGARAMHLDPNEIQVWVDSSDAPDDLYIQSSVDPVSGNYGRTIIGGDLSLAGDFITDLVVTNFAAAGADAGSIKTSGGISSKRGTGVGLYITSTDDSTTKDNGAVQIKGGVGIAKQLNVGDSTVLGADGGHENTSIGTTVSHAKLTVDGAVTMTEQATNEIGSNAGYGQLWVKTANPTELWFTDDDGNDFGPIGSVPGGSGGAPIEITSTIYGPGDATTGIASIFSTDGVVTAHDRGTTPKLIQNFLRFNLDDVTMTSTETNDRHVHTALGYVDGDMFSLTTHPTSENNASGINTLANSTHIVTTWTRLGQSYYGLTLPATGSGKLAAGDEAAEKLMDTADVNYFENFGKGSGTRTSLPISESTVELVSYVWF